IAAVDAYFPLHPVASADSPLRLKWPDYAAGLLQQQVKEPLEEIEHRPAIPALTAVDNGTSVEGMRQYEENPYPRWTINPLSVLGRPKPSGDAAPYPRETLRILDSCRRRTGKRSTSRISKR